MVQKTSQKKKALTAHGLLGALSYWGTAARLVLVSTLVIFAYALNISYDSSWQFVDSETLFLIYGLATILVLDAGYVMAARMEPVNEVLDRWVVMLSDLVVASFFVIPSLFYVSSNSNILRVMSLFVALLILAVRILVGLLFAKRK